MNELTEDISPGQILFENFTGIYNEFAFETNIVNKTDPKNKSCYWINRNDNFDEDYGVLSPLFNINFIRNVL